jgi:hypothetical protein
MSTYNVTEDREEWARVKASLLSPGDRRLLLIELMKVEQQWAAECLGVLASEQHGLRARARRA